MCDSGSGFPAHTKYNKTEWRIEKTLLLRKAKSSKSQVPSEVNYYRTERGSAIRMCSFKTLNDFITLLQYTVNFYLVTVNFYLVTTPYIVTIIYLFVFISFPFIGMG